MPKINASCLKGCILIAFLACIFLLPTLNSNYIIIEDQILIKDNPKIESLHGTLAFFSKSMYREEFEDAGPLYRPVVFLSLYFNRLILGHHAASYHAVNLALHIAVSILLYLLLSSFWGYSLRSLLPSLLFAVHPVHIDNVGFIINRSDILASLFALTGAMILAGNGSWKRIFSLEPFARPNETGLRRNVAACLLFLLALMSKESASPALAMIFLLICFWGLGQGKFPSFHPAISGVLLLSLTFAAYFAIRLFAIGEIGGDPAYTMFPQRSLSSIIPTISRVFADYITILFAPFSLRIDYTDYAVSKRMFAGQALLSYIIHLSLIVFAFFRIKKNAFLSFCIISFYIALIPVSQIVPFYEIKAERLLYIPSFFFFLAITYPVKYLSRESRYYKPVILLSAAVVLFWGSISFDYSTYLRSQRSFWSEMARRSPRNVKFLFNLGLDYFKAGEPVAAVENLSKVLEIDKNYANAYFPLAASYAMAKDKEMSFKTFERGLSLFPESLVLNKNFAILNLYNGKPELALTYIDRAIKLNPREKDLSTIREEIIGALKETKSAKPGAP